MKKLLLFLLLVPAMALPQGTNPYNTHVAVTTGNWDNFATWGNPIRIYSTREKKISNGVTVTQNLTEVGSNRISFDGNGKIVLSGSNKISFTQNSAPITSSATSILGIVDNIIVDFADPQDVNSQTGFLQGLGGVKLWDQARNNLPLRPSISALKPKMFRQAERCYYQESYTLTQPTPNTSGRVHMIVSEEWALTNDTIMPLGRLEAYKSYLDGYFAWGVNKPGIVWECWNEPDGQWLEPLLTRPDCTGQAHPCGDEAVDYWPIEGRQHFHEIYNVFYKKIRTSALPSTAQVAGPSFGYFNKQYLKEFFDYCLKEGLEVNVVTWHEINYPERTKPYTLIKEHVDYVRKNFKDNIKYAALNIQSIEINEMNPPSDTNNPAGILASIAALETADVDYSCKSCWDTTANGTQSKGRDSCRDNSLNDLFTVTYKQDVNGNFELDPSYTTEDIPMLKDDATTPNKPKSAWWVYKLYGDGVGQRVKSYSEEGRSVVLASKPSLPGITYAQVLFGYVKRSHDDTAASYLPDTGAYKIRLTNLSPVLGSNYFKVRINRIPYRDTLDANGEVVQKDNSELTEPEFITERIYMKDAANGLDYTFLSAVKENLYQMTISAATQNEYLNQPLHRAVDPEKNVAENMVVYPNPGNGIFTITVPGHTGDAMQLKVYNAGGQKLIEDHIGKGQTEYALDLTNYAAGLYLVTVFDGQHSQTQKIIKR